MPSPRKSLTLRMVVSDSPSAIKFAGGEGEYGKMLLDFYVENGGQLLAILALRGREWKVTFEEV